MTKIYGRDEGGFELTEQRDADWSVSSELNYDARNMAVGPTIDFLYAMKSKVIDEERQEDVRQAIDVLEGYSPETEKAMPELYEEGGRLKASEAVKLLENEKEQVEQINKASNGRLEDEQAEIEDVLETVQDVYENRFEHLPGSTVSATVMGPYRQRTRQNKTRK